MSEVEAGKKRLRAAMLELDALESSGAITEGTYLLICDALKLKFKEFEECDPPFPPPPSLQEMRRSLEQRRRQRHEYQYRPVQRETPRAMDYAEELLAAAGFGGRREVDQPPATFIWPSDTELYYTTQSLLEWCSPNTPF